ncbi:MAG: efflux transporter outer membrane subunit [Acidobacteriaceae bacterium]
MRGKFTRFGAAPLLGLLCMICGCSVGPKYHRPPAPTAPQFKQVAGWRPAQPQDRIRRGQWWEMYGDRDLDALEQKVEISNQSLKVALNNYTQARAEVQYQRANYFPFLNASAAATRQRGSENRTFYFASKNEFNDFNLPLDVSWEPDVWGRIRHTVQLARANAQSSAADVENVRLSVQAELALDYFEMRGLDHDKKILDDTVDAYRHSKKLTVERYRVGLNSALDVAQAETQLETAKAQDQDVTIGRAQFEDAIAVLVGEAPANLTISQRVVAANPFVVPAGLPSQLLERRPDIAAVERQMDAANAQIGIARSAYYPTFIISGQGGFESSQPGNWFAGPSSFWAMGASAFLPLVDWGQRHALNTEAHANYDATVANYRQTVLSAYQEVEDNLVALRVLQSEAATQHRAVESAQHQEAIAMSRYRSGLADYLTVIVAQSIDLSNQLTEAGIQTRRMAASVLLIKALGGGWNASQLPRIK